MTCTLDGKIAHATASSRQCDGCTTTYGPGAGPPPAPHGQRVPGLSLAQGTNNFSYISASVGVSALPRHPQRVDKGLPLQAFVALPLRKTLLSVQSCWTTAPAPEQLLRASSRRAAALTRRRTALPCNAVLSWRDLCCSAAPRTGWG